MKASGMSRQKGQKGDNLPCVINQNIAVKHGRPKQGEERIEPLSCIEWQASGMDLVEMLEGLPTACDPGTIIK